MEELRKKYRSMMKALFREEGASLRVEILSEPEVTEFIGTHAAILDSGFGSVRMSDTMRRRLQESDWMFSGMKTFHELNEAFPSLVDEKGGRKPFERFLNDVQAIDSTYNGRWLNAEYNFAQAAAQMAGKWEKFADDGDEYLLQYRTAGDDHVRPEHAALNGVTLPAGDSFWDTYYPPNGWNCRCNVVQVLRSATEKTPHDEAMTRGEQAMRNEKNRKMFAYNPGKQERIFPAHNPYTISRCTTCSKAKINLAFIPDNQQCEACQYVRKCYIGREEVRKVGDGTVRISTLIDRKSSDYDRLVSVAEHFAGQGAEVELTPKMSRPASFLYDCYYKDLRGTRYEGKCPDMRINGVWYEHEGFITDNPKNAFRNMLRDGLRQSDRLIIDRPNLTDRYMLRVISERVRRGEHIKEIWLKEASTVRMLYGKT